MTEQEELKQQEKERQIALSDVLRPQLYQLIEEKFKSTTALSKVIGIPNTTIRSALDENIFGVGVGRIIKICHALGISVDGLAEGKVIPYTPPSEDPNEEELSKAEWEIIAKYRMLGDDGRQIVKVVLETAYQQAAKNFVKDTSNVTGTG